jgi:hypothetical protein
MSRATRFRTSGRREWDAVVVALAGGYYVADREYPV